MLENWRYNRALEARKKYSSEYSQIFLDEEYKTQQALNELGIDCLSSPSEAHHVGTIMMAPEQFLNLRVPYAVEVLGMPHAGKTTILNRYMQELWQRDERNKVGFVTEGAAAIKGSHGDLRYADPFAYSMLSGTAAFVGYIDALKHINSGMRMIIADRGQVDRRVWRRSLFQKGEVNPEIMLNEDQFIYGLENTPVQVAGIIMFMIRPQVSIDRVSGKTGPTTNIDSLTRLYEQYWRLHWETLEGDIPFRVYTCIDAEKSLDEVYERFKYAADSMLNIHSIYSDALAKAFPEEFNAAVEIARQNKGKPTPTEAYLSQKLGGKKVKIIGGDEMGSEEEILNRPVIETLSIKSPQ